MGRCDRSNYRPSHVAVAPDEVLPVGEAVAGPSAEGQEDFKATGELQEVRRRNERDKGAA